MIQSLIICEEKEMTELWSNQSLQPTPDGAGMSAFAVHAIGPAWLSLGR